MQKKAVTALDAVLISLIANSFLFIWNIKAPYLIPVFLVLLFIANIMPLLFCGNFPSVRLRICCHGATCLKIFLFSSAISVVFHIAAAIYLLPFSWMEWMWSATVCIATEAVIFWNGIISVYCSSVQLGIRLRAVGFICGLIPIVHLLVLGTIIKTVSAEVEFETEKWRLNECRRPQQICRTKYPILLVHGVFFRDYRFLNYWGRIPGELEKNGAEIYYGNHQSAASVRDCAAELADRIKEIVEKTAAEG